MIDKQQLYEQLSEYLHKRICLINCIHHAFKIEQLYSLGSYWKVHIKLPGYLGEECFYLINGKII